MGGTDGFGAVVPEADEPAFHAPWEARVLACTRALGYAGVWSLDEFRAVQERLPPATYLTVSYYKRWALGLELMLLSHDLVGPEELAAARSLVPGKPLPRRLDRDTVGNSFRRASFERPSHAPARFAVGDRVRTRNIHPQSATRLPRYARGCEGAIERLQGCHVFPDSVVLGRGEDAQWLYTVVFDGRTLWGEDADPGVKVSIEAFEPYLEPATVPGQG